MKMMMFSSSKSNPYSKRKLNSLKENPKKIRKLSPKTKIKKLKIKKTLLILLVNFYLLGKQRKNRIFKKKKSKSKGQAILMIKYNKIKKILS